MGPWRAAARGVAVEVLRYLVSGLGEKERCPVGADWRSEEQAAYWREEAVYCRDRLREAHSCSVELDFLRDLKESCWDTPTVGLLVLIGAVSGVLGTLAVTWWQSRPRAGVVVAEIDPGKLEVVQEGMNWLPLDNVLVRFVDDPALYHQRIVLRCSGKDKVHIVTPDREVQETELKVGSVYSDIRRMHNGRLPTGISENETYLNKHSGDGAISRDELLKLIRDVESVSSEGPRRRVTGKLGDDGRRHPPAGDAAKPKQTSGMEDGVVWVVVYSSTGQDMGTQVSPPDGAESLVVGGLPFKMFTRGGSVLLVRGVLPEAIASVTDLLQAGLGDQRVEAKDVRVLPVLFDTSEERWRTIAEAVVDHEEVDFEDFPLQGPRTVCRDARQLRRLGLDFVQHHEAWCRKSGVRQGDRSVHEHASLCRSLNLMVCYDQLNVGALASAESLNRRRALIEMAHNGRPEAPNYDAADDVLGIREMADGSLEVTTTRAMRRAAAARGEKARRTRAPPEQGDGDRVTGADPGSVNLLGARKVFREPVHFHGDVFPLPCPVDDGFPHNVSSLCSRRSRQRVQRRRCLHQREYGTIWALNHLAGFDDESLWPATLTNRAQAAVLARVKKMHLQRPPPPEKLSPQAALRQLLQRKAGSAYGDGMPGQLASYVRDRLSLPRGQGKPVRLEDLLPEAEREMIMDFRGRMMLSDEEHGGVLERGLANDMYTDPLLEGGGRKYHGFVADLVQSQLVGFTAKPKSQVGVFVVTKKNQKQRLILDARRTNKLFRTPPTTRLGSMDSWARVGIGEGDQMFVSQEDVKDFFYRLGIGQDLGEYFSLPPIDAKMLQDELGYLPAEAAKLQDAGCTEIFPYMCVLPMGFSWAFHLAHEARAELSRRTLPRVAQVRDREPAPLLGRAVTGGIHEASLIYADNHNHLGINKEEVDRAQTDMIAALHSKGLDTHDLVESTTLCESLGVRIDGLLGTVQVSAARDHRLDQALLACSSRPALSGEELQVIVGHMTMRALLNRGLLSILRHIYVFIQENYLVRRRLWPSVVREIEVFRGAMVLGVADLRASWDPKVYCTDACPSGYAVLERHLGSSSAREVGKEDERWRYYRCESQPPPRAAALGDVLEDVRTVLPDVEGECERAWTLNDQFPEVPRWVLDAGMWQLLWRAGFDHKDGIHMLEARSILGAVKHVCRDSRRHGAHVLVLNDNMGTVLAAQKGRCAHFGLLRVLRRVAAHTLGCGIRCHVRWVPSELNVADHDSRWRERRKGGSEHPGAQEGVSQEEKGRCLHEARGQLGESALQEPSSTGEPGEAAAREEPIEGEGRGPWNFHRPPDDAEGAGPKDGKGTEAPEKVRAEDPGFLWGEGTRKDYATKMDGFLEFVRFYMLPIKGEAELDEALCEYADHLFLSGETCNFGQKLQAALEYTRPEAARDGSLRLPRFKRALKGWRKLSPAQARLPMIEFLKGAVSGVFLHLGRRDMAVFNELTFSTYVRPGEGLRMKALDFVEKQPGQAEYKFSVIVLAPIERGEASKAGIYDEVLVLDDTRAPWLEDVMRHHVRQRLQLGEEADMWDFNAGQYLAMWRKAVAALDIADCAQSPYQNRHGGASRDHLLRLRSVHAIQRRGRWAVDSSARIYDKPGRLQQMVNKHSKKWWDLGEKVRLNFRDFYLNGTCQLPRTLRLALDGCAAKTGECAKAFAKEGGWAAIIDVRGDVCNDLSKFGAWNRIRKVAHLFDLIGIDLPCNTWTRARRAPPWSSLPGPLRGDHYHNVLRLPNLRASDREKVDAANRMMIGACNLIKVCLQLNIPGYMENPLSSRLWLSRPVQELLMRDDVHFVKTHMCMHGTQWKKPTGLLVQDSRLSEHKSFQELLHHHLLELCADFAIPPTPPRAILRMGLGRLTKGHCSGPTGPLAVNSWGGF
ncbi:UPF1 [Symbiodinium sp. CCMP2592]|nr:UPF1 [Symbiodinium sp. CCMP2592]